MKLEDNKMPSQLFADFVIGGFLGTIDIEGYSGLTSLDAEALKSGSPDADAKAHRFELITAARGGKHIELSVTAQTYAQTKKPNRRYLRLADDQLESSAKTWKGQPYLVDHNTYSMKSSMGTILSSKAVPIDGGTGFQQTLQAVKADAVIGILDGTFNKFSIGWWPGDGPILCSVHGCNILKLDGCNCWPGEKVKLDDGRERIVEFIFTTPRGKETSSVVIPAVQDTNVNEVRAALAAELSLPPVRARIKESKMKFHRLAVALGLTALSEDGDEDRALAAVAALQQRANTAEANLGTTRTALTNAESAIGTLTAAQVGQRIDASLQANGYAAGKMRRTRDAAGKLVEGPVEAFLRGLGTKGGLAVMEAQLAAMPIIVPVGQRPQSQLATEPDRTELGADDASELNETNPYLVAAAAQTGQKVADLVAFARGHVAGARQ